MMKSKKELSSGRRACNGWNSVSRVVHNCWLCAALLVFMLFLVGVHHSLMDRLMIRVDVVSGGVATKFALHRCMQCNAGICNVSQILGSGRGEEELSGQRKLIEDDEKFMYYSPHSGFNNQLMELRNALLFAKILNRTLIVPPVLDHHAAWLGSCPKRRVLRPHRLRALVWTKIFELFTNSSSGRYTSMADIIDLSSITPSKVKTMDMRIFLALWCDADIRAACGGSACKNISEIFANRNYGTCAQLLNPLPKTEQNYCVHSVDNDCTSTIWKNIPKALSLVPFATQELRNDSTQRVQRVRCRSLLAENMSNEWKVEKATRSKIEVLTIESSLGSNSYAGTFCVLAFGSMFSMTHKGIASHIDIRTPSGDKDLDDLVHSLHVFPYSSYLVAAAKKYIQEQIAQPFYCAQIRLQDGQFKNHWNSTFQNLLDRLTLYKSKIRSSTPTSLFLMTDLALESWTRTDLKELLNSRDLFHVHKIDTRNDLILEASWRVLTAESGFLVGFGLNQKRTQQHLAQSQMLNKNPHVELAMEEIVCSCAKLGFSGTQGSTMADKIRDLRAIDICSNLDPGFDLFVQKDVLQNQ